MEKIKKKKSRKLDDQATIYSLSRNGKDTSIFRLSVTLKEKVEPTLLTKAVNLALKKYKDYKVKMKAGFFEYYFDENEKNPVVTKAKSKWFKKLHVPENNEYLFQVTYETKKINIEIFHPLTDGNGGTMFFKEIISRYLELRHPKALIQKSDITQEITMCSENAYIKNYQKKTKRGYNPPFGYTIKGKKISNSRLGINHFSIKLSEIKALAKQNTNEYAESKECFNTGWSNK